MVALAVLGQRLDQMILEIFSSLGDLMISLDQSETEPK